MLFNSVEFLIFLPVVIAIYAVTPRSVRWLVLLIASYYFYMSWKWQYGLLILSSTAVNYIAGIVLSRTGNERLRGATCLTAVVLTLGVLFTFKYLDFCVDSANAVSQTLLGKSWLKPAELILPVGISFYTFQTLSYTIDVYRHHYKAVGHFGKFALYVVFFPQLVAGPIERPQNLLPQLLSPPPLDPILFSSGLRLILWGLIKKVVIADHLALYVNAVYNEPDSFRGLAVIFATLFFSIQIYCDFSGYSDIAVGAARLLGIRLMDNFRMPYFSTSIQEFWRRWHISLSTWFRDYVYIPLGGNRGSIAIQRRNLLLTFVISGLWHGAAWTFVIWGAIHGGVMVGERWLQRRGYRIRGSIGWLYTFAVVTVSWVFFRANKIGDIPVIFQSAVDLRDSSWMLPAISKLDNALCPTLVVGLLLAELVSCSPRFRLLFERTISLRFGLYVTGFFVLGMFGMFGTPNEFIYFQF